MDHHQVEFRAMNTEIEAQVYSDRAESRVVRALQAVGGQFRSAERRLSRFDPASELSQLNASAHRPFAASPLLFAVVRRALAEAAATGGLFDPTVIDALEAAGYDRSFELIAASGDGVDRESHRSANDADSARIRLPQFEKPHVPGAAVRQRWRLVELDARRWTIRLPSGVRLDLGGIAKGWVVDGAAEALAELGACLVNAGGDLMAYGAPPDSDAWWIGLADPTAPERDLAMVKVRDAGLATSGRDRRRWQRGGRLVHHLIDPRTGEPAPSDALTVTAIAPSAAQAEVHAKVAFLLGVEEGIAHLERQPDVAGLVVHQTGQLYGTSNITRNLYGYE